MLDSYICYHLRDAIWIAIDPGIVDRELDAAICIFLAQTKCGNAMAGAFAKIHRLTLKRDPARCETLDIEKVVDHPRQVSTLPHHYLHKRRGLQRSYVTPFEHADCAG